MWETAIFRLAAERGWRDCELARRFGVNQSTISRLRHHERGPSRKVVLAAEAVFGQPAAALFWYEPEEETA